MKRKYSCKIILLVCMMNAVFSRDLVSCQVSDGLNGRKTTDRRAAMVTVKSSQKIFTEEEISGLTGICREHLRDLARSKHLGSIVRAAVAAGEHAERRMFTNSDLMVLAVLVPRCHH